MSDCNLTKVCVSEGGVVCEISFTYPPDAFRGEMQRALDLAVRRAVAAIDERYAVGGGR